MASTTTGLTSVVVVSHGSASTLTACLASVQASADPVELIVVDNASGDDGPQLVARLAQSDPRIRLIRNPDNLGFGAACNQGAALASGDLLLFLNPDAALDGGALARWREAMTADTALGLLGACVVDEHDRERGPQRRREPTWQRSLMTLTGLARWERRWPALAGIEAPLPRPATAAGHEAGPGARDGHRDDGGELSQVDPCLVAVDAVNGAAMLVRADLFHELGGFDEGFFLHAEDLDLCRRVRDAGRRVAVACAVRVRHVGGVSSRRRPVWVEWQKTRSLWRYHRKHEAGAGSAVHFAVAAGLGLRFAVRAVVIALTGRHQPSQ